MSEKKELYEEIRLKNSILTEGIDFNLGIFKHLALGETYTETIYGMFSQDKEPHRGIDIPSCFLTPKGAYQVRVRWNRTSKYRLLYEDGQYNLYLKDGKQPVLEKIHFKQRSPYYDRKLKDGTEMRSIAQDNGYGVIFITYSNECALQDKGEDCLFCNINATKNTYGEEQGIKWKTPVQIAETVKSTYDDGFHHLTVSGGFIPERREVEYYLDVAENICDVNMGSALEGHRTPEDDWHFEVQERTADIYLSNGVSWAELRNATAESDTVAHDLYRWKADIRLDRMGREI